MLQYEIESLSAKRLMLLYETYTIQRRLYETYTTQRRLCETYTTQRRSIKLHGE